MKVFVSSAYVDEPLALKAAKTFREAGLEVWSAAEILPGDNWAEAHARALESSDAMVVLLSPASVHSREVLGDMSFALGASPYKGRIIPIVTSSTDVLNSKNVPWVLKRMTAVDLEAYNRPEEAFQHVADELKRGLSLVDG